MCTKGLKSQEKGGREWKTKMCMCAFPCCLAIFEFLLNLSLIGEVLAVISRNSLFNVLIHTHTQNNYTYILCDYYIYELYFYILEK